MKRLSSSAAQSRLRLLLGLHLIVLLAGAVRAQPISGWRLGPFTRPSAANPILAPRDTMFDCPMLGAPVAWEQGNVFNPAAITRGGKVYLLYRAEDGAGKGVGQHTSRIGLAESADGIHFTRRARPVLFPEKDAQKEYEWTGGCEDPRCVESPDGGYVMTYTQWNRKTARLAVATSRDLVHWVKHGPVFAKAEGGKFRDLWSKSGSIVTRRIGDRLIAARINGKYWMLWGEGTVHAATSDDLLEWNPVLNDHGDPVPVLSPRSGKFDSDLCEPGPPAVLTAAGIVLLYNGKNDAAHGDPSLKANTYSGGQALLDASDPTRVLARDETPFISPRAAFEATGQYVAGTVFIEGLAHFKNRWWLYYGAADSRVAVASSPPDDATLLGPASRVVPAPFALTVGWKLEDAAEVRDAGDVISQPQYAADGWNNATVPGTVLTSLVNDGVYPEPLFGENNRPDRIPDTLARASYWYRTTFPTPASFSGRRAWLNFDGINYAAEVWLNGHDLGGVRGAFARGRFDATRYLKPSGPNALAVHILPPPHPGTPAEQTIKDGVGRNGGILARDGPTFLSTIGWDWMPGIRDRDTGIWQDVSLSATGPVTIEDPYITSTLPLPRTNTADLTVEATLRNTTEARQTGTLTGSFGTTSFRRAVSLEPGEMKTVTLTSNDTPALHVRNPRLWWPNGYGPQSLYRLHLAFEANGIVSDAHDTTFGIRQIEYARPGSDDLTLVVNGVPVVAKGGDWGMDEAMKRIPYKRLDAQVRMHKQANYTMIRNWVGQSTSEALYELCDKYGILVWDEFFQPNPYDGPNPDDVDLYLANVREKILRFRSHPSIALWCGRNEGDPPPAIDEGIRKLIAELERGRLYQPSSTSGRGVRSSGPYHWQNPDAFYKVGEPFTTEIGTVSIPTLESVHAMMPRKDWEVINDDWAEHDLASGAQQGDKYPGMLAARYGKIGNLADFVRKAQLANYESYRALYEGRFAQLFQPVTGVITWMSNPAQPSFVWQLYSHDLEPNASLFGTRKACEPVHVMMNQANAHLMVINNEPRRLAGLTAKVAAYNLNGDLAYARSLPVAAGASAATDLGAIPFPATLSAVHFVRLELLDGRKQVISSNFYWRADPAHPDDFTALGALPRVTLRAGATRHDVGGKCFVKVTLRNPARAVALMAHIQLRRSRSGDRVLPALYSDNYVSLLPGESQTLTVEASQSDLGGEAPLIAVDGWNVDVVPVSPPGRAVRIAPNVEARETDGPGLEISPD
jgi:predicted GH43/DUF377 family glycosyl hydrolase